MQTPTPQDDEVGTLLFRGSEDLLPRRARSKHGQYADSVFAWLRGHTLQLLASCFFDVKRKVTGRSYRIGVDGNLIGVHQHDRRLEFSGELNRCIEGSFGWWAEIGRYQDLLEGPHGSSPVREFIIQHAPCRHALKGAPETRSYQSKVQTLRFRCLGCAETARNPAGSRPKL